MRQVRIPIFVPHLGCPHQCAFCEQREITGETDSMTPEKARNIIETYLPTISADTEVEIAFFGGSFTAIREEQQNELLQVAKEYVAQGKVQGIRLSTRPDYIDPSILERLRSYGVTVIELGAQSMQEAVLSACERGHTARDVVRASEWIHEAGISLGLQMMTGLPGDTPILAMDTAQRIAELKPDCVRIYPTLVMRHTRLEQDYHSGTYRPQTPEEAVELSAKLIAFFLRQNIAVIRVGLQPTEALEKAFVAGPYHPAFGELAASRVIRHALESLLDKNPDQPIRVHPAWQSKLMGQKRCNMEALKLRYGKTLQVVVDATVSRIAVGETELEYIL